MPLGLLGWWLLAINVATFAAYAWDKAAAKRPGARRTRERTLWLLNLLGGVVGAWLGMLLLRHKTRHRSFVAVQAACSVLWGAIVLLQLLDIGPQIG
jgi:uncharacterized membrane protein YsdA (DUF1294 family)